jgi:hypothetical protein
MLKKSEKGPLSGYQRSFFSGRNLLQRVDALLTDKLQAALLPIIYNVIGRFNPSRHPD